MKRFITIAFILFGFQLLGYSQDTIISKAGSKIIEPSDYYTYEFQSIEITNRYFPQKLNFKYNSPDSASGVFPLKKKSTYNITSKDVRIKINDSRGLNIVSDYLLLKNVEIEIIQSKLLTINGITSEILRISNLPSAKIFPNYTLANSEIKYGQFFGNFDKFIVTDTHLKSLDFNGFSIKNTFVIRNSKIDGMKIQYSNFPDTIVLNNLDLSDMSEYIDLTGSQKTNNPNKLLVLGNIDFSKLKIPLTKYTIKIDDNGEYEDQITLYQTVINKLKELGLNKKAEVLDKRYQEIQYKHNNNYLINIVSRYWWDYGYNKSKVFTNSCILFFIFFIINMLFFDNLLKVYLPNNIEEYYYNLNRTSNYSTKLKRIIGKTPIMLLYTAFIFWGLKLDVKDLKVKHWPSLTLIIVEYSVGIICLAYLANYVLSK